MPCTILLGIWTAASEKCWGEGGGGGGFCHNSSDGDRSGLIGPRARSEACSTGADMFYAGHTYLSFRYTGSS